MRVHEIIEQQHTEAETESEEYRHQAEIFFGGYLAETAEGNCDGDCKHRPEQLAVRQFALIIIEMEDYSRCRRDDEPDHFDELIVRIVALYKAKTEQKERFKRNYNILAKTSMVQMIAAKIRSPIASTRKTVIKQAIRKQTHMNQSVER